MSCTCVLVGRQGLSWGEPLLRGSLSPQAGWANLRVGRGWRKGRGGGSVRLAGRRALPGVLCGRGDAALNLPIYLRRTDLPCLLFKARFIWLHSSSPRPPLRVTPVPAAPWVSPQATLSASGHLPRLCWAQHASPGFLGDSTPTRAF